MPSPGLAAECVSQDVQACAGAVLLSVSAICQNSSSASITGAVPSRNALRSFLLGALLWLPSCAPAFAEVNDVAIALAVAKEYHLSPFQTHALLCIRTIENGREGREYGVLTREALARSQRVQARWAAGTIRRRLHQPQDLTSFARRWAPVGASNDPDGLNRHWLPNMAACLAQLTEAA